MLRIYMNQLISLDLVMLKHVCVFFGKERCKAIVVKLGELLHQVTTVITIASNNPQKGIAFP